MEGSKGWRHYRGTDRGNRAREAKRETEILSSVVGREGRAVPSEGEREGEGDRERKKGRSGIPREPPVAHDAGE